MINIRNLKMFFPHKTDVNYSFHSNLRAPVHSEIIDDAWRADRLVDLDIVLPQKVL
jgi:hypothetical protein